MKPTAVKERFVEMRAEGLSYADIAAALSVSKPTLIAWAKDLQNEIANARTLRMDALFQKYAVAKEKRVRVFGERLDAVLAELDTRDLKDIPTAALLKIALDFGKALAAEAEPLTFQGEKNLLDGPSPLTITTTWTP